MFDEDFFADGDDVSEEDEDDCCEYGCGEFCSDPQTRDMGLCTTECTAYLCSIEADADGGTSSWKCDDCGCTNLTPCIGELGRVCHWVRKNLCSFCHEKRLQDKEAKKPE